MSAKDTINLMLDVETVQEIHSTLASLAKKISWVLENQPPEKPGQLMMLKERLRIIEHAAQYLKDMLNKRSLDKAPTIKVRPVLKSIK